MKAKKLNKRMLPAPKPPTKPIKLTYDSLTKRLDSLLVEEKYRYQYAAIVSCDGDIYVIRKKLLKQPIVNHGLFTEQTYQDKEFSIIIRLTIERYTTEDIVPNIYIRDLNDLPGILDGI